MKIKSREYKLMLDPSRIGTDAEIPAEFLADLKHVATSLDLRIQKSFQEPEVRTVQFYDTEDFRLRASGYVLRKRQLSNREAQITLKARNADRYLASQLKVDSVSSLKPDRKFEEDIAAPFRSRFSLSNTVRLTNKTSPPQEHQLTSYHDAKKLFPVFRKLAKAEEASAKELRLKPVRGMLVSESVYKGPTIKFPKDKRSTLAVIVWRERKTKQPLVAEFSFRYKSKSEKYALATVRKAQKFFAAVQMLGWCQLHSPTKTEFIYGERS